METRKRTLAGAGLPATTHAETGAKKARATTELSHVASREEGKDEDKGESKAESKGVRQSAREIGYPDEWAVSNLRRLRRLAARPEHDTSVWVAGQRINGVHPRLRCEAVNFLYYEVVQWGFAAETAHTAVAVLDRFLGNVEAGFPAHEEGETLTKLPRRIATVCLWLAAKMLETVAPSLANLVGMLQHRYDDEDVEDDDLVQWEKLVLRYVKYDVAHPTAYHWLSYAGLLVDAPHAETDLAQYLMDLCSDDIVVVGQPPERRAWAALWLAKALLVELTPQAEPAEPASQPFRGGGGDAVGNVNVTDVDTIARRAVAAVPEEWLTYVVLPADAGAELAYLIQYAARAHGALVKGSGVALAHAPEGPWYTLAVGVLAEGHGICSMLRPVA